jgi:hypothetical protein
VLLNKTNTDNTYLATTNFWAPLEIEEEDNKQSEQEINIINTTATKQIKANVDAKGRSKENKMH